jgi:predicted Zn-dependent peptidase
VDLEQLDERLTRSVAPNGLRVLTEGLPGVRSAAVGVWIRGGSAQEPPPKLGVAHLLEHMVFKGTERRSAHAIARALESRGGVLDASTSRDHTLFQAHILDADLPVAVDILTDLVRRPLLREADLQVERNVVLEEIRGVSDTPEDLVFELHARAMWGEHPYGSSILGTERTIPTLTTDDLWALHRAAYQPANCVIAAAGSVQHEVLLTLLEREGWLAEPPLAPPPRVRPATGCRGARRFEVRETAQCHIVFGTDTIPSTDARRYAFGLIINILGGGMSSRLFQKVREELGLAYVVYAFQQLYEAGGLAGVYVGTQPETADLAVEAILAEYHRLATEGLPADELATGKQQLKGQLVLALENPASRMHRLAAFELNQERYRRIDEVLAEIDAVTGDDIAAIGAEFFRPERQTVVRLGPK